MLKITANLIIFAGIVQHLGMGGGEHAWSAFRAAHPYPAHQYALQHSTGLPAPHFPATAAAVAAAHALAFPGRAAAAAAAAHDEPAPHSPSAAAPRPTSPARATCKCYKY
jgi:hypothetical protein